MGKLKHREAWTDGEMCSERARDLPKVTHSKLSYTGDLNPGFIIPINSSHGKYKERLAWEEPRETHLGSE